MAQELSRKSEEIRKYHAEQAGGLQVDLKADRTTNKGCHQSPVVRPTDGIRRPDRSPENYSHPREIFTVDEWSVRGRSEVAFARRNPQACALPSSTRISVRDSVRGSRRGGCRAQPANSRGAGRRIKTQKYRKGTREGPLFPT